MASLYDERISLYDGKLDEIALDCDSIHIERMDKGSWWIGIYKGDKRLCLFLTSDKKITAQISEDEIGCNYENVNSKTGEQLSFDWQIGNKK